MKNKAKLIKFGLLIYTVGVVMVAALAQFSVFGAAGQVNADCNLCFSGRTCTTPAEWESGWYDGCFNRDTGDRNDQPDYDPNTGTVQNGNEGVNGYQPGDNINGNPGNQQNSNDPSVGGNGGTGGTGIVTVGNGQGLAYVGDQCSTNADCFGGLVCGLCGGFTTPGSETVKKCVNGTSVDGSAAVIGCMQPGRNPIAAPASANCGNLALWQIRCTAGTTKGDQCRPDGMAYGIEAHACGSTQNWTSAFGWSFAGCGNLHPSVSGNSCDNCYSQNGNVVCRFEGASCGARPECLPTPTPGNPVQQASTPTSTPPGTPPGTPPQTPPPPPGNPPCQAGCTPGISVDKAVMGGTTYTVGSVVTFNITISNTGDQTLNTVAFADTYAPAYLDFTGISGSRTGGTVTNLLSVANVNEAAGTIGFSNLVTSLGALAPGQAYTLTVSFIARAPISLTCNYVNVTTGGGPTGGDNACVNINTPDTDI